MRKIIYKLQNRFLRTCGNDIDYSAMQRMLRENKNIVLIDVRTKDEFMYNHLDGAINIPLQDINKKIERFVPNKKSVIILYCEYGGRSKKALNKLNKLGYINIYNLDGGLDGIE